MAEKDTLRKAILRQSAYIKGDEFTAAHMASSLNYKWKSGTVLVELDLMVRQGLLVRDKKRYRKSAKSTASLLNRRWV